MSTVVIFIVGTAFFIFYAWINDLLKRGGTEREKAGCLRFEVAGIIIFGIFSVIAIIVHLGGCINKAIEMF